MLKDFAWTISLLFHSLFLQAHQSVLPAYQSLLPAYQSLLPVVLVLAVATMAGGRPVPRSRKKQ